MSSYPYKTEFPSLELDQLEAGILRLTLRAPGRLNAVSEAQHGELARVWDAIGRDEEDCMCAYKDQHDRDLGQLSVNWTLEHTNQASKDFMRTLPFDLRFELGGRPVLLVHGSPRRVNEYLFEDKPAKTFERIAIGADCDVMVFGHTHKPWIHTYGETRFVNCGSVGKPKDGDPRGGFAVLEGAGNGLGARIERFDYDAEYVASQVAESGLPAEYGKKLLVAA